MLVIETHQKDPFPTNSHVFTVLILNVSWSYRLSLANVTDQPLSSAASPINQLLIKILKLTPWLFHSSVEPLETSLRCPSHLSKWTSSIWIWLPCMTWWKASNLLELDLCADSPGPYDVWGQFSWPVIVWWRRSKPLNIIFQWRSNSGLLVSLWPEASRHPGGVWDHVAELSICSLSPELLLTLISTSSGFPFSLQANLKEISF